MQPFFVYMLRCFDGTYYVGHTDDLERRMSQHQLGTYPDSYTATRRPVELAYAVELATRDEARELEHKLKGWSNPKKRALERGDWSSIRQLARSRSSHPPST